MLACAMTGSGKTAAFLLPILHQLIDRPRGTTRALVLTPTRELAAQILEDLNDLAVHTPITGAAVFGGVGMGPQEHAFRSGVDVIVATPGPPARPLPRSRTRSSTGLEYLVLDEADRMLDMGFLPDIKRVLRHLPARSGRRCSSAPRCRRPIAAARAGDAEAAGDDQPASASRRRRSASRRRSTRCRRSSRARCSSSCSSAASMQEALVFTRTKHRANRLADSPGEAGHQGRAHPRQPLAGAAHRGARRLQGRAVPGAGGHRHRRARHRRRGARPRGELRRAAWRPRTTSTASAARRAPRRPARPSRSCRRRRRASCAASSAPSASGCRA